MAKKRNDPVTLDELNGFISEAQRRQFEEQGHGKLLDVVLQHYADKGIMPTSENTFKKTPINVMRRTTADERKLSTIKSLLYQKNYHTSSLERAQKRRAITRLEDDPETLAFYQQYEAHHHSPEEYLQRAHDMDDFTIEHAQNYIDDYTNQLNEAEQAEYKDEAPVDTPLFNKNGTPKMAIRELYSAMRGTGYIDKDGDLIAHYVSDFGPTASNQTFLRKAAKNGAIQYDERTDTYIMPKAIVKKLDPYYKDYNTSVQGLQAKYKEFFPNALTAEANTYQKPGHPITEYEHFWRRLGKIMSLRGMKNLSKSSNLQGAFNEIGPFLDDKYRDLTWRRAQNGLGMEYNSMNELRGVGQTIADIEAERYRQERVRQQRIEQREQTEGMTDQEVYDMFNQPFEYTPGMLQVTEQNGWRLPEDEADLIVRGREVHNCVGSPYQNYAGKIQSKNTLILIKENITAEIGLKVDKEGTIKGAHIVQIQLPSNKPARDWTAEEQQQMSVARKEIEGMAQQLLNQSVNTEADGGVATDGKPVEDTGENDLLQHLYKGGYVGDPAEEDKLLKAAEGYKGTPGIKSQLVGEAETDGLSFDEANSIVDGVLRRLNKTESGKKGGALGVAHKATDRYAAIKSALKGAII
jgi:hypothetical protein